MERVSVARFGARGEGREDATAAVQRAIAALRPGDTLYFPAGEYRIASSLIIGRNLHGLSIQGAGREHSRLVYTFRQEDTTPHAAHSLLVFERGLRDVAVEDLEFRYAIPISEIRESYGGRIHGLFFQVIENLTVARVSVIGFNHGGLAVVTQALGEKEAEYAKNVNIRDSQFSGNRVAGVEIGNADGVLVERCLFYHNGLDGDGGTGYGLAGLTTELPRNVVVRENRAILNVRKGIDFHAGENVTIEKNTVARNGLFGIFAAGDKVGGEVKILGNEIRDMHRETTQHDLKLTSPTFTYKQTLFGIYVGRPHYGKQTREGKAIPRRFTIEDNLIHRLSEAAVRRPDFTSTQEFHVYPLFAAMNMDRGEVLVRNNRMRVQDVTRLFTAAGNFTANEFDFPGAVDFEITGNLFAARLPPQEPRLYFANARQVRVTNNRFVVTDQATRANRRGALVFLHGSYETEELAIAGNQGVVGPPWSGRQAKSLLLPDLPFRRAPP